MHHSKVHKISKSSHLNSSFFRVNINKYKIKSLLLITISTSYQLKSGTVVPGFSVLGFSVLPGFRALNAGDGAWSVHKTLFGFSAPLFQHLLSDNFVFSLENLLWGIGSKSQKVKSKEAQLFWKTRTFIQMFSPLSRPCQEQSVKVSCNVCSKNCTGRCSGTLLLLPSRISD